MSDTNGKFWKDEFQRVKGTKAKEGLKSQEAKASIKRANDFLIETNEVIKSLKIAKERIG